MARMTDTIHIPKSDGFLPAQRKRLLVREYA